MENDEIMELGNILIYQTEKGDTRIDVFFQNEDIWMNQSAIAKLYNTTPQNITMHIRNIYADGELDEFSTCKEFLQVQTEGNRQIKRKKKHPLTIPVMIKRQNDSLRQYKIKFIMEYMDILLQKLSCKEQMQQKIIWDL